MPMCRSHSFFVLKCRQKEMEETYIKRILPLCQMDKRLESKQIYKVYWREKEHEVFRAGGQEKPLALFFIIGS